MKLHEHVALLKSAIENAYDKEFARLGFGKNKVMPIEHIPAENQARRQRFESMLESHIGETGDYEHAREKLVDELTFTLFNRLAAVKVMEAANLFPPIITKRAEHGGRSFGHKAWLETNPHQRDQELEGLRNYIKVAFDKIGTSLPLFSSEYPFSLFPDTISLNEIIDLFNALELDSQIDPEIWASDDVLGWCYESYNNSKKKELKDSGQKIEYNYVSLQSQVYTPRWVVQFLVDNSLGKLYFEMYPNSHIKQQLKIANMPESRTRDIKPLHEVKIIDPACGSGNFLLYAFDLLHALYLDQIENYGAEYSEADIPQLIIENNLNGIDLDDRAVQLAQLGLFIKASKKSRSMQEFKYRIVSSDFYLPGYSEVAHIFEANTNLGEKQRDLVAEIWEDLQYAYKFGSLIRLKEKVERRLQSLFGQQGKQDPTLFSGTDLGIQPQIVQTDAFLEQDIASEKEFITAFFTNLRTAVDQYARTEKNSFMATKTQDAITFLELLTTEYDVATANPPYTDSSDFGLELKSFIDGNYKKPNRFNNNLYGTFFKRCFEFCSTQGKMALIHPYAFMFIKTFEDFRRLMINDTHIDIMVDWGLDRVNLFAGGYASAPTFYVLSKTASPKRGLYFRFTVNMAERDKKDSFFKALKDGDEGKHNKYTFELDQLKLKIIKSWPLIYWISDTFREKFKARSLEEVMVVAQGLATGSNSRFLRYWWEISNQTISEDYSQDQKKWVYYAKGGPFKKWVGNIWAVVNWENNGSEIKSFCDKEGNQRSRPNNEAYYFRRGLTYTFSGSTPSFRILPENSIFDVSGSSLFIRKSLSPQFVMGFLNSKLTSYIINCLNPTASTQVGDLKRIPFEYPESAQNSIIEKLVDTNIQITSNLDSFRICNPSFESEWLSGISTQSIITSIKDYMNYENHSIAHILINDSIINIEIFKLYDLSSDDRDGVLEKEGLDVASLPVCKQAQEAFLNEDTKYKSFYLGDIKQFVESLPTTVFGSDEKETFLNEFSSLYQSNNDLEAYCIRHQINPINVWYWFKQSDIIPKHQLHTFAMEFLVDMVREILMEDEDGIIPLVSNAGEKILVDRIEEKFNAKGFSSAQYSNFDSVLGRPISEYLNNHFFAELSDHLNLFMYLPKTPFIWHLSSGPEQGFDCYIIIYKWSRDNLMRLRSVYIENRERALVNRQSDLVDSESASAQNEKDLIFRQLQEIESFKSKIDELLAEGYDPILDDGVGKNIAPLQKKGMIPYDVLNPGQLKKYLNADW